MGLVPKLLVGGRERPFRLSSYVAGFPTAALPSIALSPHAVFDDPDTLDFAAHEIARLQKSLRIHEVGNAGRGSRRNHIAGKERHRTACISHQRIDAEIEV